MNRRDCLWHENTMLGKSFMHRTKIKQNEKNKSSITVFANKRQSSTQITMVFIKTITYFIVQ